MPDSAYPLRAIGPTTLNVLAVWAQQRPTYVRSILSALEEYRDFLVDYCFVPESWVPHIRSVEVGGWAEWEGRSDHRPVVVEVGGVGVGL